MFTFFGKRPFPLVQAPSNKEDTGISFRYVDECYSTTERYDDSYDPETADRAPQNASGPTQAQGRKTIPNRRRSLWWRVRNKLHKLLRRWNVRRGKDHDEAGAEGLMDNGVDVGYDGHDESPHFSHDISSGALGTADSLSMHGMVLRRIRSFVVAAGSDAGSNDDDCTSSRATVRRENADVQRRSSVLESRVTARRIVCLSSQTHSTSMVRKYGTQNGREAITKKETDDPGRNHSDSGTGSCSICLGVLNEGDIAVQVTCGHIFHKECAYKWLLRAHTCPICRSQI